MNMVAGAWLFARGVLLISISASLKAVPYLPSTFLRSLLTILTPLSALPFPAG